MARRKTVHSRKTALQGRRKSKVIKFQIEKRKLGILLAALGIVLVVFSQLFEVRVISSGRAKELRKVLLGKNVTTQVEKLTYEELAKQVIPEEGKTVLVEWGDMGKKLVSVGAIDRAKFAKNFPNMTEEMREILEGDPPSLEASEGRGDLHQIKFTLDNIVFWTDVLWALGLTQKSKVLTEGPMQQNAKQTPIVNYASTAGWTLGARDAMRLYNSVELVKLTPEQDELVFRVAENIFRPCCGNSTAYPDCNHGMAVLGLLTLMAAQGAGEEEMYKAALAFNSYAFADTYINAAAYLTKQGKVWGEVTPKEILGAAYSSGQGAAFVAKAVGEIPGAPKRGASCGA